ncbi:GH92 family glycosyl hydrolase [Reichenbachiella carrageenanivorans]|uniref:GH92 family glycosyl hydrolase n=1 Tax=Reichenbachiella carrageenanivorans TaxID=2979869 RepID=A0ABY6D4C9_9BACT|nr:GH92 family glycosyl hydrolase [Reichenbachiella carrageenanivorans]UXX80996.1 GH92 family glycosyl hydrolase [Reichenbachiella carrageenanivorans]
MNKIEMVRNMNIKKLNLYLLVLLSLFSACQSKKTTPLLEVADYVNPFIGTTATGNTFPGAVLPSGMAAVSPHNIYDKALSESTQTGIYVYGEPYIYGFGQTHLSGVGCHMMGNVILNPSTGDLQVKPIENRSAYENEIANPGYYSVDLTDTKIKAELSATMRVGLNKFSFPKGQAHVTLDMSHPVNTINGGQIKIVSPTELEGYEIDGGFCGSKIRHKVFYVAQFSQAAAAVGYYVNGKKVSEEHLTEVEGDNVGAYLTYDFEAPTELVVKVGISYVSIENARKNIEAEVPDFDFEKVRTAAATAWDSKLNRISLEGGSEEEKEVFYSALYHTLILPFEINDANGDYPAYQSTDTKILPFVGREDTVGINQPTKVLNSKEPRYSAMSLWDTYRTTHPLFALVYPDMQTKMVKSMLGMYQESGRLPMWPLIDQECGCMVGDPATLVIADTYMKGLRNYDVDLAYEAMTANANYPEEGGNGLRAGGTEYARDGYIPEDKKIDLRVWGTVSTALEYAHADAGLANVAKDLGKMGDYEKYRNRSLAYQNYWNKETGFLQAKNSDGSWLTPFDPLSTAGEIEGFDHLGGLGYVEGNAWQYLFFVPHDPEGLQQLMGGEIKYLDKLQACFDRDLFVLWNEPDMSYPYFFNHVKGEEWRTQKYVQESLKKHFNTSAAGLPGNDDAGTLSCWAVFSMMGLYPDCPGTPRYQLTTPTFDKVMIKLDTNYYKGKSIVLQKTALSDSDSFEKIKSILLNGKPNTTYEVSHDDLTAGAKLEFVIAE